MTDVRLPVRVRSAHKGECGRVLVVAGSRGMTGAPVLAGSAALRSGAGLVTVATPDSVWPVVAAGNPCIMTLPLADLGGMLATDCIPALLAAAARADVVAIGPGLGRSPGVVAVVRALLAKTPRLLLDADAINAIVEPAQLWNHSGTRILTPHTGEFARLTGWPDVDANREEYAARAVREFGGVMVLKGAGTVVADVQQSTVNTTGNPGMATAGAGDVLTGVIAGLWGQGLSAGDAARLGVYLHGLAGDLAARALGPWSLTASDLLDYLPRAFQTHAGLGPREEPDARAVPPL